MLGFISKKTCLVAVFLLIGLIPAGSALAQDPTPVREVIGLEGVVGVPGVQQVYPAISGDKVVWQDDRNGNVDIYMYDLTAQAETQITTNVSTQTNPDISGSKIVWEDRRNGNFNSDIYMYDIATQIESQVTSNVSQQFSPSISGDKIVWQDGRNASNDIYMYDLATQIETQVTTNDFNQNFPVISGDKIVWQDDRNGNSDIYMYDLTSLAETQLTDNNFSQTSPVISGNKIVWQDNRNGNQDIYMYDLANPVLNGTQVTISTSNQFSPFVSGDKITYGEFSGGSTNLYVYNIATGTTTQVTNNTDSKGYPVLSGNRIVWQNSSDGGTSYHIYLATLLYDHSVTNGGPLVEKLQQHVAERYISVGGSNMSMADSVTFNVDYTIAAGDVQVVIPAGTVMTNSTVGGTLDLTKMVLENITEVLKQASNPDVAVAISIGIPSLNLKFSQPITIVAPVGADLNGRTLDVYYQGSGQADWTAGLNCLVANGLCQFQTDHATKYLVEGIVVTPIPVVVEKQKAKIDSWNVYQYKGESKCVSKLKLEIKGRRFDDDVEVHIGTKEASKVDVKSSKRLTATFCLDKLLEVKTGVSRKIKVTNPGTDPVKAKKKINLTVVPVKFGSGDFNTDTTEGVKNIQTALFQAGYLNVLNVSGKHGSITVEAVRKFQAQNGLSKTGILDDMTKKILARKSK